MSVRISADSTCDLSRDQIEKNDVGIAPLYVILNGTARRDGIDITPEDVFSNVAGGGRPASTSAVNVEDYRRFFARRLEGGDGVLEAHALDRAAARHGHDAADGVERGRLGDVGESEARHDLDEPRVFLSQVVNAPREVECLCHDVLLVWDATVRGPGIPGRVAGWRPLVGFRRQGYVSKARQTVVTDTFTKSYCETSI